MLKRIFTLLLAAMLLLCCLPTAQAGALSPAETYAALQEELRRYLNGEGSMPLSDLAAQFNELGTFRKSAHFGYYTAILRDTAEGDYTHLALYTRLLRLDTTFCEQLPEEGYPSVDELEAYALGCQADAAGDWPAAIAYYEKSIAVLDSLTRVARLWTAGPTATPTPVPTPVPTPTPTPTPTPVPTPTPRPTATPTPTPTPFVIPASTSEPERKDWISLSPYSIRTYDNHTCAIEQYFDPYGPQKDVLYVPSTLSNHQVTGIAAGAFSASKQFTTIVIPDGVTYIGDKAFEHSDLKYIDIPDSVLSIGNHAFHDCSELQSVELPMYLTTIEFGTFHSCEKLTSVTIPPTVTRIRDNAFSNCPNLTFCVKQDSYAHEYAISHGIPYTFY